MIATRFTKEAPSGGFTSRAPRSKPPADAKAIFRRCTVWECVVGRKLLLPENNLSAELEVANKVVLHLIETANVLFMSRIIEPIEPNADRT
jgi:hypothetical protein